MSRRFLKLPRREAVGRATCEAVTRAESERIAVWVAKRELPSNVEVHDGCDGRLPEGVTITVHVRGIERETVTPLLDDIDLDGSLKRVRVDPECVKLVFVPMRSTDVYEIALRRLDEALRAPSPKISSNEGPYR